MYESGLLLLDAVTTETSCLIQNKMLIPYLFKPSAGALVCDSPGQLLPFWEGTVIGGL